MLNVPSVTPFGPGARRAPRIEPEAIPASPQGPGTAVPLSWFGLRPAEIVVAGSSMTVRGLLALAAAMLVTFVLGSVHAYSVFIVDLEASLGLDRAAVSLVYSFALVALTVAVLVGHRWYAALASWWMVLLVGMVAGTGMLVAAAADSRAGLFIGYSLLFGFANGLGYGYCLQLAGRVIPAIGGFAMGAVTATYAFGSILFASYIALRIETASASAAMTGVALVICASCGLAALVFYLTGTHYCEAAGSSTVTGTRLDARRLLAFWFAYATAVFSGLMAIGHAAGIALAAGASIGLATAAAMTIGIGSTLGGFVAGWLVDRVAARHLLAGLPLLATVALLSMAAAEDAVPVVSWLTLVGFCYGALIAVYPVAINREFGRDGPRAYGRIFTAWGFAGLAASFSAGLIYDRADSYGAALVAAALLAVLSAAIVACARVAAVARDRDISAMP